MNKSPVKPYNARIRTVAVIMAILLAALIVRLYYIQMIDYERYQSGAFEQYTKETPINAKRGTIYDRNMKALAVSATVETVCLTPYEIKKEDEDKIATFLSELFDLDKNELLEKMSDKKSGYKVVKKKVERDLADKVREFIKEEQIEGVHLEEDSKRYYPYSNLASHVIGFTNADNTGIYGVEAYYDEYLKGTSGKIITAKNAKGRKLPFQYESYIGAENGTNVVLTIDWQVQSFLEKSLETALKDTNAKNRVFGIVMDVNTGGILAMSTKPDYDLNNPFDMDEEMQMLYDEYKTSVVTDENGNKTNPTSEQCSAFYKDLLEQRWKNKVITETYEPGSTFKIITSAMALEENIDEVNPNHTFVCNGSKSVGGYTIHCHKKTGHGVENFEQGLQNSCNPVFMELAESIGKEKFYKYFEAFGFMQKTGIDLAGEVSSIYHTDINGFNQTELAVYSFGQTFRITPIQLLTAECAVANGGNMVQPHVLKALVDDQGNVVKEFETNVVRQVNSEQTGQTIMTYLANGINLGSTKNAYVKGYNVAAKTGTSQKRDKEGNYYIGSCVAFAPADDPQVAILIAIDEPVGEYYGGTIAAPVVSSVLSEVLPYLNIEPAADDSQEQTKEIFVTDYVGLAVTNAKNSLHNAGLTSKIIGDGDIITDQFPKYGTRLPEGSVVVLYTTEEDTQKTVKVPDISGFTAASATRTLLNSGLNIKLSGAYRNDVEGSVATKQTPEAGSTVVLGTTIEVEFRHLDISD